MESPNRGGFLEKLPCVICGMPAFRAARTASQPICESCRSAQAVTRRERRPKHQLNSCPACDGSTRCAVCDGTGRMGQHPCHSCMGDGTCASCANHVAFMVQFLGEFEEGELGSAEATLKRALIDAETDQAKARLKWGFLGKGGGAVAGTAIYPGIGTILGLIFGDMTAEAYAISESGRLTAWRKADLLFCLSAVYSKRQRHDEARELLVQALVLNEHHEMAREALRRIDHGAYGI